MPNIKLRQDIVRSLPYRGTDRREQCIYWDEALECFGLRVHPGGRRVYVCSYRVQKRKRLACLGRADVLTLDQARKKAMAYLGKVASNEDPQSESDRLRTLRTIEELCTGYITHHAKPKKKTWKEDESALRRRVLPKLKTQLAVTIATQDIEAIHAEVGARYPGAANILLGIIRKMFNWGRIAGFVPKNHANPACGIVMFPSRKRRRFITIAEMPRFIEALEQEDSDYARYAIWLLLLTGLRCNELLGARWENVDWDHGTLFVGLTKNGEPLLAPLTDAALEQLRAIPRIDGNPYIICGKKPARHLTGVGVPLRRILKRAGLENIRVHDLRRTVGSWLAQNGMSLHLIGQVLNHKDAKTTAGYAYFQTQQRRDALAAHGEKIFRLSPAHLRRPQPPATTEVNTVLAPELYKANADSSVTAPIARRAHYLRREALYELVWTAPVSEIAGHLHVSDVALAKLCRRAGVPTPPRGYWSRIGAGQCLGKTALPQPPSGLPELLRIRGRQPSSIAQLVVPAM